MFVVFYTVKIVYICVFMTCSTSCHLCDTYGSIECECMHVCVCMNACIYACMPKWSFLKKFFHQTNVLIFISILNVNVNSSLALRLSGL